MRRIIVAGNWKMNKTTKEAAQFFAEFKPLVADVKNAEIVIGAPFTALETAVRETEGTNIKIAAENMNANDSGAYTGEVSAEMVNSTGAEYVILGHSERRTYYGETLEMLKTKVRLALDQQLQPIFCIGEVLSEREAGKQFEVVRSQIEASLFDLSEADFSKIILAYEPVWAIGTGKTATAAQAQEMHAFIRGLIADKYGKKAADDCSILYGGSCKASNAAELFANPDVDGGLIGGASLTVEDFMGIVRAR